MPLTLCKSASPVCFWVFKRTGSARPLHPRFLLWSSLNWPICFTVGHCIRARGSCFLWRYPFLSWATTLPGMTQFNLLDVCRCKFWWDKSSGASHHAGGNYTPPPPGEAPSSFFCNYLSVLSSVTAPSKSRLQKHFKSYRNLSFPTRPKSFGYLATPGFLAHRTQLWEILRKSVSSEAEKVVLFSPFLSKNLVRVTLQELKSCPYGLQPAHI